MHIQESSGRERRSVEPGIYRDDFGVRSEIDVYLEPEGPRITTPCQRELMRLGG